MTPLERAARALVDNYPLDTGESPLEWNEVLPVVRAVLTAIREPSEVMANAGGQTHDCTEYPMGEGLAEIVWERMIDAALAEGV